QSLAVLVSGLMPVTRHQVVRTALKAICCIARSMPDRGRLWVNDRDRGTPRGAAPPTPPGIRVTYLGGSTRLGFNSQCRCEAGRENRRRGCGVPFEPRDVLTFAKTPSVSPRRPQLDRQVGRLLSPQSWTDRQGEAGMIDVSAQYAAVGHKVHPRF